MCHRGPVIGYVIIGPRGIVWPKTFICDDLITAQIVCNQWPDHFIAKCWLMRSKGSCWIHAGGGLQKIE
jgi:hypothetical protein